jgi:hypothetical protein
MPPLTSSSQCAADNTTENLSWTRAEREAKKKEIAEWMAGFGKEKWVRMGVCKPEEGAKYLPAHCTHAFQPILDFPLK